tara:strand:- start:4362 stop:5789 length:1428 start_codon:yes stop_codon:yes gene_type:complete
LKINNNLYIKGTFHGKYQANVNSSTSPEANLSKIHIVEANIDNATKSSYMQSVRADSISLNLDSLVDVKINLDKSSENYQFIEDLCDVVIFDIEFSNIIKEGDKTFGTIKGNIYGGLFNQDEIEVVKIKKSKPEFIISKPKPKYIIVKDKIKSNFFPYLTYAFYAFLILCFVIVFGPLLSLIAALIISFVVFFSKYIFNVFHFIFKYSYLFFLLLVFYGLGSFFFTNSIKGTKIYNEKDIYEEDLNSDGNLLMSHKINWNDNSKRKYSTILSINSNEYYTSKKFKKNIPLDFRIKNIPKIYSNISKRDYDKLSGVYNSLKKIKSLNPNLSRKDFADVIVTMVQNIPYGLQLIGDCEISKNKSSLVKQIIESGYTCDSYIKYGLYSPLEFIANFKGDCDTRTVFLYTIFKKFNYDAVILNSLQYQHSILGINLPSYGKFKNHKGKKYYVWETTAPGYEIGILPKKISDLSKWNVVI